MSDTAKRPKIKLAAALMLGFTIGVNITLFAFSAYSSGIEYAANMLILSIVGMLATLAFAGVCLVFLAVGVFAASEVVKHVTTTGGGADL